MYDRMVPCPGQIYRHFKNKLYQIVAIATHSETGEKLVIYQRLYDDFSVYARPYDMFMSKVDHDKYPDVIQEYRFELISTSNDTKADTEDKTKEDIHVKKADTVKKVSETVDDDVEGCNPDLIAFLDAETCEEKRELLISIRKRIDDRLINDIAASMDVTVDEGDIDTRFKSLLSCIDTLMKYECTRLR